MQRGFLAGAVGGVLAMAAGGGVLTHLLAGEDVQHTTIDTVPRHFYVKVDGHPAVERTILQARIESWYHPLPWVGEDIGEVSCPAHLKAVAGATETCTARAGGERVSIPVRVTGVEGDPATPRVTWKFER
ncbi:DUF4333 domain-containing protein [Streptomyces coeruleorubidus]|uniref:DUF4333 domain-containing protein n=1 Tax=Streptomyces coeruleorubidus TaxID=116188 RepID=A0ABZ0K6H7_STRC4|nr:MULTISPECIES: DUF4333 domain-containing protein [Streptomyces]WOT33270.1 DUF4333 domain-containing protein [Streptomyces coeruleorubidus]GGT93650.1 hypothetical protein GCM10010244_18690 [Streptomyces bellus]